MPRKTILLLVLFATLWAVPNADAYIYWVSRYNSAGNIGRANLAAGEQNNAFIPGIVSPRGLATNSGSIYWGTESGYIGYSNLDGSDVSPYAISVPGGGAPFSLVANDDHLYTAEITSSPTTFTIDTGGTPVVGNPGGCGMAIDSTYLYWAHSHFIGRSLLNGLSQEPSWLDLGSTISPCGLAVNADHIYWTHAAPPTVGNAIGRANINGTGVDNAFITGAAINNQVIGWTSDVAVEGNFIYWTNAPNLGMGSIGRASLDGTGVDHFFLSGMDAPLALSVDASGAPAAPPGVISHPTLPAPQLTGVGISGGSFAPSSGSTSSYGRTYGYVSKKVQRGAVFAFKLDQAATVSVSIEQKKAGRKVKGKCKKPSAKSAKKPKCNLVVATLTRDSRLGSNTMPFTGRIKGRALKVGSYQAVFTASGEGGKSPAVKVPFRIVKP